MDKYTKLTPSQLKLLKYKAKLVLFIAERGGILLDKSRPDFPDWEKKIGGILHTYRGNRFITRAQLLCLGIAFDEDKKIREQEGIQSIEERWDLYIAAKRRLAG